MKKSFIKFFAVLLAVLLPVAAFASPASDLRDKAKSDNKATELIITFEPDESLSDKLLQLDEDVVGDIAKILKIKSYIEDKTSYSNISLNDKDIISILSIKKDGNASIAIPELDNLVIFAPIPNVDMYSSQQQGQKIDKNGITQDLSIYTDGYKSENKDEEKLVNDVIAKCIKLEAYSEASDSHDKADKKLTYKMTNEDFKALMESDYIKSMLKDSDEYLDNVKSVDVEGELLYTNEGNLVSANIKVNSLVSYESENGEKNEANVNSAVVYNKKTSDRINHNIVFSVFEDDKKYDLIANIDCYDNKVDASLKTDDNEFEVKLNSVEDGNKLSASLTMLHKEDKLVDALYNMEASENVRHSLDISVMNENEAMHLGKINVLESFVDKKALPEIDASKAYSVEELMDEATTQELVKRLQLSATALLGSVMAELPPSALRFMGFGN